MTTRRGFLLGATGALAMAGLPGGARSQSSGFPALKAQPASIQLAPSSYPKTDIWGYDGLIPGPVLRVQQGGRVQLSFHNGLQQPSSVHWRGIRSDNAMDGVPGLTQDAVPPGGTFDYDFVAPDAGTFWYHAHNRSLEQVARGLYGALIVEEATGPDIDREETLILDDWRLNPETAQIDPNFTSFHDLSHAGRIGNFVTTNGRYDLSVDVRKNERLRLRLINASNAKIFALALSGFEGWTVALDGMPLETPKPVSDVVLLGPGQRADLIVDVIAEEGEAAYLVRAENDEVFSQAAFPVRGTAAVARRSPPDALPPNPNMQFPDLDAAEKLRLNMEGGAMGRLDAAILDGNRKSSRQLADASQFWAFNGTVGMTDTPLAEIARGKTVRLEIVNDTVFPHAMHLHGMHFREVMQDGTFGPLRDTLLTFRGETREIAFIADNPGDWLFHCHMLSHAASGMMTWLRVT